MFKGLTKLVNFNNTKQLFKQPSYTFSYYSSAYLQPWQVNKKAYCELTDAIGSAHNCHMIGEILKDNLNVLTDYQLSYAIFHIWNNNLELDEHFYGIVSPIVKEYVKNFDRECNKSLAEITKFCGWMGVQDNQLWELLDQKLYKESLYRYIGLEELVNVTHALAVANRGNKQLFEKLEQTIIKHRLALTPGMQVVAKEAFETYGQASPIVFKVLEDPKNVDLTSQTKKLQ